MSQIDIERMLSRSGNDIVLAPREGVVVQGEPIDHEKVKQQCSICRTCKYKSWSALVKPCNRCRELSRAMPISYYKEVVTVGRPKKSDKAEQTETQRCIHGVGGACPEFPEPTKEDLQCDCGLVKTPDHTFLDAEDIAHDTLEKAKRYRDASECRELLVAVDKILQFIIGNMSKGV